MAQTIEFTPCTDICAGGSKRGSIFASAYDLETMFGEPAFCGKGDKITTEFCIEYKVNDDNDDVLYGTFALYDWHYGRNFGDDFETIEWNVGGKSYDDTLAADFALKLFKQSGSTLEGTSYDVPEEDEFYL